VALALAGAVLGAATSAAAALSVTRPLRTLAQSARRMSEGDLATPLAATAAAGEVETLRRTLEEMRQALHARDRERETMLAGIAHEVRNPLGAMELFAGALAADLRGRPEAAHVARIQDELGGLARLVTTFLDYARIRPLAREELDAAQLAAELRELALPLAEEHGVALAAEGSGRLCADRDALRRAALNLVRNAVEASPRGAAVEIALGAARGEALLEVRDRGGGLSEEERRRAGEPFYTTKQRGTGLGVALAARTAAAHGGRLELRPREGGGTVAALSFPAGGAPVPPGAVPA
jgi:signal transduction histidine kinase